MLAQRFLRGCIAGAIVLPGCAARQAPEPLKVLPNLQVRHSANDAADAYYQLGRNHQQQGNLSLALSGYTYAIARDPRHMEARNAAAAIHAQQGRLDQARAMMLALLADYPHAAHAYNNLGYIDHLRGAHAVAVRSFRRALEIEPRNERARNNLRLVETAMEKDLSAVDLPVEAPAAPLPVTVPGAPQMALIQVVPNVYELKMTPNFAPRVPVALSQPTSAAVTQPLGTSRIEVANGVGTAGLARRVGALFRQHGFPVARLSNEKPFGQHATRIEYRPDHARQAEALRKLIDGPVQLAQVSTLATGADLRVVLGKDTQRAMALRDTATRLTLAAR